MQARLLCQSMQLLPKVDMTKFDMLCIPQRPARRRIYNQHQSYSFFLTFGSSLDIDDKSYDTYVFSSKH